MSLKRLLKNNVYLVIILLFSIISFIYLLVFFIHFNTLSNNIDDYSSFAVYLGGLGSIASIATLIIILIDNNQIRKEKLAENKQKNILYLVEHFSINPLEESIFTNKEGKISYLDNSIDYSEEYLKTLDSVFNRINYLYRNSLILKDYIFMDQIKYVVINKISATVFESLVDKYEDQECINWLRFDNIRWRLSLSIKE